MTNVTINGIPTSLKAPGAGRAPFRAGDLTDEDIAAIETSEMAPGFEHLNAEVDDV